jgi:hypothetical protein
MDLISQKALLNHLNDVLLTNTPNGSYDMQAAKAEGIAIAMKAVEGFRTVPAVPLDKLCEWLSENSINIPCEACPNFSNEYCTAIGDASKPCPKTANDWREAITKWMEEQDD